MRPETRRLLSWLLPVLVGAAVLRLVGIAYGLPFPMIADEEVLIGGALRMAQTGEIIPTLGHQVAQILYYPVLLPWLYLLLAVPVLGAAWVLHGFPGGQGLDWVVFENVSGVFLAARLASVGFSLATVALVGLTARRLFGSRVAGAIAALLTATSWFSVVLAHSARHWSATVFFIWLAAYIAMRYLSRPSTRRALLLGLASGLGFGVSYIGAVGLGAGLLAHGLRNRRRLFNRQLAAMLLPVAACVVLFSAAHWSALTRLLGGSDPMLPTDQAKSLGGFFDMALFYLKVLWWAEPVSLVAGVAGLVVLLRRHAGTVAVLVGAGFGWLLLLYLMMPWEDRYIMPALPLFALAAGGAASRIEERLSARMVWPAAALGGLLLLYPLATSGWMAVLMASTDTRVQAAQWLEANLPTGAPVVVDLDPVTVPATVDGLIDQQSYAPGTLDARMRLALETGWPKSVAGPELRAVHVNRVLPEKADAALYDTLHEAGYRTFAIAVRDDAEPTGLQRAVLADYEQRALFLASDARDAPHAPDLRTTVLVDGPVWRLFKLDRLGRSVLIAEVPPAP